jgi:Rrf2 family iron-sulfur cluster assembly transcriptional regulator
MDTAMKLTAKGRYGVTAMGDLAVYGGEGPISLGEISERQSISQPYLEQLFAKLKANHLVLSVRGPGGGYRLGRDSQDIDVADIVASVDESVDATRCGGKADCQGGEMCLTHELWSDLSDQIHGFLKGVSLASLAQKNHVRAIATKRLMDRHDQIGIQAVQLAD